MHAASKVKTTMEAVVSQDDAARSLIYENAIAALRACQGQNCDEGRALQPVHVLLQYLKLEKSLAEATPRTTDAERLQRELERMRVDAEVSPEHERFLTAPAGPQCAALLNEYLNARSAVEERMTALRRVA